MVCALSDQVPQSLHCLSKAECAPEQGADQAADSNLRFENHFQSTSPNTLGQLSREPSHTSGKDAL